MSWAFPPSKFSTAYVLDQEVFNDGVLAFSTETDGNLNEQNFAINTLADAMSASPSQTEDDIGMRIFQAATEVNPHAATSSMFKIPQFTRWSVVDGSKIEFTSPGGKIFVIIDLQLHCPLVADESCGTNYCIELDGAPQMNSLLGTGDISNEFIDTGLSVGAFDAEFNYGTSPAMRATQKKLQVKGSYTIAPGVHTVRLLVRNLVAVAAAPSQFISQHETIILHLWA